MGNGMANAGDSERPICKFSVVVSWSPLLMELYILAAAPVGVRWLGVVDANGCQYNVFFLHTAQFVTHTIYIYTIVVVVT